MLGILPNHGWDYEDYPSDAEREARCKQILIDLVEGAIERRIYVADSRQIHFRMFDGMTPPDHGYFAGHYRGEDFPLLKGYGVKVNGDPRVGSPPTEVAQEMGKFLSLSREALDQISQHAPAVRTDRLALLRTVSLACALLVEFLRIHPYANGNGHIGRFIVWAALTLAGIYPRRWPLNAKVPAPYGNLISEYRNGNRDGLVLFVLSHL